MSLYSMRQGTYFLGDPCYVLSKENWKRFTEVSPGIVHDCNGNNCISFYTKYGDGKYTDSEGHEYYVDSGTIGLINVDSMDAPMDEAKGHGRIVRYPVNFLIRVSKKESLFDFGGVIIDTDTD